jgi:hypothetical protein
LFVLNVSYSTKKECFIFFFFDSLIFLFVCVCACVCVCRLRFRSITRIMWMLHKVVLLKSFLFCFLELLYESNQLIDNEEMWNKFKMKRRVRVSLRVRKWESDSETLFVYTNERQNFRENRHCGGESIWVLLIFPLLIQLIATVSSIFFKVWISHSPIEQLFQNQSIFNGNRIGSIITKLKVVNTLPIILSVHCSSLWVITTVEWVVVRSYSYIFGSFSHSFIFS